VARKPEGGEEIVRGKRTLASSEVALVADGGDEMCGDVGIGQTEETSIRSRGWLPMLALAAALVGGFAGVVVGSEALE
jgi:hypothetical protein